MSHNELVAPSIVGSEDWNICTPSATSEDTTKHVQASPSSIPWPGRTFIIRSRANGLVITFLDGQVILDKPGGLGTFRWRCVEEKGWLGFKDPASALYLGCDKWPWLRCAVPHHRKCEFITPRMRPDGGCVLLACHGESLQPLGVHAGETDKGGVTKVKVTDWDAEGIVWDFIEVQSPE
ncbi:major facilitator superfamily transporter multidrug resistance [Pyrenophora seminiperda CCB06]|uniref:Major facilitator superfamily transporter multidrug resistance n=1 Tax=Pyrenophora seminiperda CCB06 TaxID=1302712 RepID=A0A3M7MHU6_9PLEO|nr:major facilitator superfamily transporter multidrug resistance [Pyrenophora seminiperda CCB06]